MALREDGGMDDAVTALGDQQAELAGVGAAAADTGLRLMGTSA